MHNLIYLVYQTSWHILVIIVPSGVIVDTGRHLRGHKLGQTLKVCNKVDLKDVTGGVKF